MFSPTDKIRPKVRDLAVDPPRPRHQAAIQINHNENPFGLPAGIKTEILQRAMDQDWARYPDSDPIALLKRLADYAEWTSEGLMAGNGSHELIQAIILAVVEDGVRVVLPEPTISVYRRLITVAGGEIVSVPLNDDLTFNIPRLASKIVTSKAQLTIICSPNNPTGCVISTRDLTALLRNTEGLIVVDQAYLEIGGENFIPLLQEHRNLVILRTFSKALAMAGLRVGYGLAAPELIREFNKVRAPYSLNFFSLTAAEVVLDNLHLLNPLIAALQRERERLFAELREIPGLSPVPSIANFFCVRTMIPPPQLFEQLLARGILIRDVSRPPLLADCVRISVGTPEENEALIAALREICGNYSSGAGSGN
ncbi:MAG TPA: histidinol-phosphate transaminase [Blastocatellia bacterium]|nr:histidinol-phosphate transaminase [Blastocatellia bacterium]